MICQWCGNGSKDCFCGGAIPHTAKRWMPAAAPATPQRAAYMETSGRQTKIGTFTENRDGSYTIHLDALPISGVIKIL